jgi:FixJ family two-component response regulator
VNDTVFVIDDDISVREGLSELIESLGLRVQALSSAQEFLGKWPVDVRGCIVLDVQMPGMSGLDLQRELKAANVHLPIIFLTGHGDIPMTVQAMKAGAVEFLTKPFREQQLLEAIQHAIARDRMTRAERNEMAELEERYSSLTPREREVMLHVVRGLLNKQIAAELGTSEVTVKLQRSQVMQKMQAGSVAELVRMDGKLEAYRAKQLFKPYT